MTTYIEEKEGIGRNSVMFCHECGNQLSEEAIFCPKCGTKIYCEGMDQYQFADSQSEDKLMIKKLDVTLIEAGSNKAKVIKLIRERNGLDLKEVKDLVDNVPSLLEKGVTEEEAEIIKMSFAREGAKVVFTDQDGNVVNIAMHCDCCGAVIEDGKNVCDVCGKPYHISISKSQNDTQRESGGPHDDIDKKQAFGEFKEFINEGLREAWKKYKEMSNIWQVLIAAGASLIIGFCMLIFIVLLRLIFSSIITLLIAVAGGYIVYQRWVANYVVSITYEMKSNKLQLPEKMDTQALLEALSGKFNYPYFKGVRYGEKGECVIEGKYSEYTVLFDVGNVAYLTCNPKTDDKQYRTILLEAITIRSYINKFFNPTMPIDVTKDYNTLKSVEKQRKAASFVFMVASLLICLVIGTELIFPGGLQWIMKPGAEVRGAYLTQYSENVTIEEAFENYFDNGNWRTYEDNEYSYVVFTGSCEYLGERADVKVTFKITGDNFIVDSLDLNGREQNDWILYGILSAVYEDY